MELRVDRKWKKEDYCVSDIYVDGEWVCNGLEDTDRGLDQDMEDWMIRSKKIPNRTAVPTGRYKVLMNTVSPKFSKYPFYMAVCGGRLPRLKDVNGFDGILLHCADGQNGHKLVSGCIGVGLNTIRGGLTDGKRIFKEIYAKLKEAHTRGETIYITIE